MIYNNYYDVYVSKNGLIFNLIDDKLCPCKTYQDRDGYLKIIVSKTSRYALEHNWRYVHIHRIVANTFLGEQGNLVVDHIGRNRQNNDISNLRYCTPKENANNSKDMSGENNPMYGKDAWAIARARKTPEQIEATRKSKSEKMKEFWATHPEALAKMKSKIKGRPSKLKGRTLSDEHRRKLMGRIPWNKGVKQKEVNRDGCSL